MFPVPTEAQLCPIVQNKASIVCSFDNVLIAFWRGPHPDISMFEEFSDVVHRLLRAQRTAKVSILSIIGSGSRAPNASVRDGLRKLHEELEPVVHRTGLVYPGGGFAAAAIRSVVLGLRRRVSRLQDQAVFQRLDEAIVWATSGLATANGKPVDVERLHRALCEYLGLPR